MSQCCSISSTQRCTNSTVKGSKHCKIHRAAARKAYEKYKQSHSIVDDYDHNATIKMNSTKCLLRYYAILNRTYIGRLNHQIYSFAEETRDSGHAYQIELLKSKMSDVENKLATLSALNDKVMYCDDVDIILDDDGEVVSEDEEQPILQNINTMTETRHKLEEETQHVIDKYTLEHQENARDRSLLEEKICSRILLLYPQDCHMSIPIHVFVQVIVKCSQLGYFTKEYTPCKLVTEIYNPANVFTPLPSSDEKKWLNYSYPINILRCVYRNLLFYGNKITYLIEDMYCFTICYSGNAVFQFPFKLLWDNVRQRLIMSLYIRSDSKMFQRLKLLDQLELSAYRKDPELYTIVSSLIGMVIPLRCVMNSPMWLHRERIALREATYDCEASNASPELWLL